MRPRARTLLGWPARYKYCRESFDWHQFLIQFPREYISNTKYSSQIMAPFSNFSIEAILGLQDDHISRPVKLASSNCSCSPRSDISDQDLPEESFESYYVKSLALHQIRIAQLQLLPPVWTQKQQQVASNNDLKSGLRSKKYSNQQTSILLQRYEKSPYVPRAEMAKLSEITGLSMLQVMKHFFEIHFVETMF